MTNKNLHLMTSNASFESLGFGWVSPTSIQPDYAGFFDTGSYKNLAMGGLAVQASAEPTMTAGVVGTNPPYMTLSPSSYIQTQISPTDSLTVVALCSLESDKMSPLVSNYAASVNSMQIRAGSAGNENIVHFFMQIPGSYVTSDLVDSKTVDKWAIRAFTMQATNPTTTAPSVSLGNYDLTTGKSQAGGPVSGNAAVPTQTPLLIGADFDGGGEGSVNVSSIVIVKSVLSSDDISAIGNIMRNRASDWGVTV